jgi:quercetin dioxygenase-like cupin family protein
MNERVHDPNRRLSYVFSRDGENLIVDVWAEPGADLPPHFHPSVEERWSVVEGWLEFKVAGEARSVGPADGAIVVAPGVKHSMRNRSKLEVRSRVEVRPASTIQEALEDFASAAREALYTRAGIPSGPRAAVRLAELVERHRDVIVVCSPPRWFQRLTLSPLLLFSRGSGTGQPDDAEPKLNA